MNPPVGDERSARQLRNDVDGLYDMLGDINTTVAGHTVTLAQHSTTLDLHTDKLDQIIGLLETR